MHAYDSDTEGAGVGDSRVQGQPGVCYERPCLNKPKKEKESKTKLELRRKRLTGPDRPQ